MNLKTLLNDLENLEKNIGWECDESDIDSIKEDLCACIALLKTIMGEPVGTVTDDQIKDL